MKILIADDEPMSRRLLTRTLERAGYEVLAVGNGRLAVEQLCKPDGPRLALLDWIMPELDGPGVCREVHKRPDLPYIHIVMLTSKGSKEDIVAGLESGAADYVIKPWDPEELKARLRVGRRISELEDRLVEARETMRFKATQLAESEAKLHAVLQAATQIAIIATDLAGLITVFNPGAEKMLGYSAEEMVGRSTPEIFHLRSEVQERGEELTQKLGRPIEGFRVFVEQADQGAYEEREWTYVRKDGTRLTVILTVTELRDVRGNVNGFLGIAKDITKRKRAESELRESKEMFEHLFAAAPDAIVATDERGNIAHVNAQVEKLFGYDRGELLGKSVEMLIPERFRHVHPKHREGYLEKPRRRPMGAGLDLFAKRKDGSEFPVDIMLSPLETAGSGQVLSVIRDITERKQVQEAFAQLSHQNELILNSAGEGIYRVDPEGRTTFVNPAAARMVGWKPEEMIGKLQHALVHHTKADGTPYPVEECPIYATLRGGEIHRVDSEVFWRKDGTCFPIEAVSAPIRDRGKIAGAVILFSDITKRKEAERQILSALQMKSDFVSFAAHQLRTPLSGVKWLLELAAQEESLPAETASFIQDARQSAQRLIDLVNDLLDVSRVESGNITLAPVETDLAELTREVLKDVSPQIELRGHRVSVSSAEKIPPVRVDPQLFRQAVLNLVNNAIKYTLSGGEIGIQMRTENGFVRWSIQDNGIGIPKASQAHLFEKFYRAENVCGVETEGTGLGLYMARLVVERSGGQVRCESEEGKGSTFILTLPLSRGN